MELTTVAEKFIEQGYSVIPCGENKTPSIPNWGKFQVDPMTKAQARQYFAKAKYIGLLTGGKSRVVCFDFDLKYDLTGTLWERFKESVPKKILKKVYVQTTKNNGYHIAFIAPASRLKGNQKFASRYTTPYEQHVSYMHAFNNPDTRDKALKIGINDKSRVLIETRSGTTKIRGGYFLIAPSPGYTKLYGKFGELTEEEYDIMEEVARSFNEVKSENDGYKNYDSPDDWELTPFEHYNENGDALDVLVSNGWEIITENTKDVRMKRPGQTHSNSSALYDKEKNIFNCFTTSTGFDVDKGHNPTSVFIELECDGSAKEAYKKLIDLGWGRKK
ncbi:MAG: bifunctional DNA primase/polymerase [Candidatus Paceibacterota bacterium]